ncbi:MAG: hypothetical protein ABI925_00130 [Verrucomicrobiota bacterium]
MFPFAQHDREEKSRHVVYDLELSMFVKGILLALSCLLVGCGEPKDPVVEQTIEQIYQLEPTGSVSIRNDDGCIDIYGADVREMRVEIIKRAYSKERLDKIEVNVSAQPSSVSIETRFPKKPHWGLADRSGTVDYALVVPQTATISRAEASNGEITIEGMRGASVHSQLENGRLYARNCFSDFHTAVSNGTLTVIYDWWEKAKFSINARVANGNATVFMPGYASFHLVAEAATGKIGNDFAEPAEREAEDVTKIDRMIGSAPIPEITLRADDGNIEIIEQNP